MPDELKAAIQSLARTIENRFSQPQFIPGCQVKDITDIDQYATNNGWIEAICGQHNQQRVRYKGFPASIAVDDYLDVVYFPDRKTFEIFGAGGTSATGIDAVKVSKVWEPDGSATVLTGDNNGDTTVSGHLILDGSSKAVKGSGSNAPDLGTSTDSEKFGSAYLVSDLRADRIAQALHHPHTLTGDATESEHFEDNDSSYPVGWTETDAAADTNTNNTYSMWFIEGNNAETSYDYRRQTAVDLENDCPTNLRIEVGPLFFRNAIYSADADYYIGIYRDNSGIDVDTFARFHLQWDSAGGAWQVRAEVKDSSSGTQKDGTWLVFSEPLNIPIWFSIQLAHTTNRGITTLASWPITVTPALTGTVLQNTTPSTVLSYGNVWLRLHQTRGAGGADRIFLDGINFTIN